MRWSSNVFLLFLLRRLRLSLLVSPVSSSSSSPSLLMSSSSKSSLSLRDSESEWSASDECSSPSSGMWSERRLRCFFRSVLVGGSVAPAREEERLRAAVSSSVIVGVGGWMSVAMLVRWKSLGPSSESASESELSDGRDGSVLSGNSFPGLSNGPCCVAESCRCSQRDIRASSEVMLLDGVRLIRVSPGLSAC